MVLSLDGLEFNVFQLTQVCVGFLAEFIWKLK